MLHRWYEEMEDRHPDPLMQCDAAKDSIFAYHTNKRAKDGDIPRRTWQFRVAGNGIDKGESICLSGSCPELGSWKIKDSVIMTRLGQEEDSEWTCTVPLPMEQVEYRYAVCIVIEPDGVRYHTRRIIVRRWETNVIPRIIKDKGLQQSVRVDEFGHFDHYQRVDRGWLTTETVIQLKLFNNPIQMWKSKLQNVKLFIKVTPVHLTRNSLSSDSMYIGENNLDESLGLDTQDGVQQTDNWPISEVAVMCAGENQFRAQSQFGRAYNKDDVIIFNISLHNPEMVAYLMDFYAYSSRMADGDPPYHVGFSYVLPVTMKQSLGQTVVPITSTRQQPIGQINVEYVVINPIPDFECDMSTTYTRHWKQNWLGLDVGHRGLGNSFNKVKTKGCTEVRENTIASLKTAASHGADFVEFDVQLSKDLVPVIYHDFYVCISMKRKNEANEVEMLQLPVKELTLEQLHLLKVYHLEEGKDKRQQIFDEDLEEHQPFPTLQQVLEDIDPHIGFNIEIKWTMQLKDGTYELNHPFDLNMYLDTVLKVVLQHGGSRKIVFSCFHPDICTMIRLKQNKYPVMFLTQGVTDKYPMYNDPICQTIPMAVHYAISANILGINVHTEDILRDSSQVKLAKDAGLVIFCWGEDNNDAATIRHLKDLGMHAVLYDKMDQYNSKEVKESIFLAEARAQKEIRKIMSDVTVDFSEAPSHHQSNGYTLETAMSSMTTSSNLWSQNSAKDAGGDKPSEEAQDGSTDSVTSTDNAWVKSVQASDKV